MAGRGYERLGIEEFGKHLLVSGDLDPVYIALTRVPWDKAQVKRWLVAYWCLYHCGAASYISTQQGSSFWLALKHAAENTEPAPTGARWPRGHERRHWRGQQAVKSWRELSGRYSDAPEAMVDYILGADRVFGHVAARVREHRGFGPWIGFKVADMIDRVLGHPVDFTEAAVFMFKDPVKAALMLWRERLGIPEGATWRPKEQDEAIHGVVEYLTEHFRSYKAPPALERPVGLQEVETILCKWKSHLNGHYPLFNDINEIRAGTRPWAEDPVPEWGAAASQEFLEAMPRAEQGHWRHQ